MNRKIAKRVNANAAYAASLPHRWHCPNCDDFDSHFVPPSFGEAGFYSCKPRPHRSGGKERSK